MSTKIARSTHYLEMDRCEVLKVSHWNIEHFKRVPLYFLIKYAYPEEAISIVRFMRRMIEQLLIPMWMPFFRNKL